MSGGPAEAYARLDARLRTIRTLAIVLGVLTLSASAFAVVAASHYLGLGPSSEVLRRGEATVHDCRKDLGQLNLMYACRATVTWEPEETRRHPGMRDHPEIILESRRPVTGRVAVESHKERWSTETIDNEVVMVAGDHRRAGAMVAVAAVGGALVTSLVVTRLVAVVLSTQARRSAERRIEGEGSEPRGRRIA